MKKILVVDDEPAIRELVVAALEDEGYVVVSANNGRQALELLSTERPELVEDSRAVGFLPKPFELSNLFTMVDDALAARSC